MISKLLNEKEVAEIMGCSVRTLQKHRQLGRGLPFLKLGKKLVAYRAEVVAAHIEERRIRGME
jgi:phage terminase Nu1 subunit (DNA packaging protein)